MNPYEGLPELIRAEVETRAAAITKYTLMTTRWYRFFHARRYPCDCRVQWLMPLTPDSTHYTIEYKAVDLPRGKTVAEGTVVYIGK